VRYIVKLGDGSLTDSSGTTISGLDEMPGTLADSDSINTITTFNVGSLQSASPLTATDAGADATITIAAHNVIYDSTTLAYNSGSVTGLAFATQYYVYADDATKSGGAVTYVATTTLSDTTASVARYAVGDVITPADGAGDTSGNPGAGRWGNLLP